MTKSKKTISKQHSIISTDYTKFVTQLPTIDEIEAELSAIPNPKSKRAKKNHLAKQMKLYKRPE